jgi:hypothetical protein
MYFASLIIFSYAQVNNFITLAAYAKAFAKINFNQFVQNNPQDLRQQTTL